MKRICSFVLICVVTVLLVSCSIPPKYPQEGIYYCEELGLSIDFSIHMEDPNTCVKLYNEDGTYQVLELRIGYGEILDFWMDDGSQRYLYWWGRYKFKDDKLILKNDKEYIFLKQAE